MIGVCIGWLLTVSERLELHDGGITLVCYCIEKSWNKISRAEAGQGLLYKSDQLWIFWPRYQQQLVGLPSWSIEAFSADG